MWDELRRGPQPDAKLMEIIEEGEKEPGGIAGRLERTDEILAMGIPGKEVKPVAEIEKNDLVRERVYLQHLFTILGFLQERNRQDEFNLGMTVDELMEFATKRLEEVVGELAKRSEKQSPGA